MYRNKHKITYLFLVCVNRPDPFMMVAASNNHKSIGNNNEDLVITSVT